MEPLTEVDATETPQLAALDGGNAFVELAGWRTVAVRGADARAWLHDLVTTDVDGLVPGRARRSLLLTPTGRIRADFHVAADEVSFLLMQAGDQPEAVDAILAPYVLSSAVELEDTSKRVALFAVLGGDAADDGHDAFVTSPSVLGAGRNVVVPAGEPAGLLRERLLAMDMVRASPESVEAWRIHRGFPRMGADFGQEALPAEAGLEDAIDLTKGCFLGQESVAKVRNLGHPPRLIRHVRSEGPVGRGATIFADGSPVGEVTSAVAFDGATDAIIRVRWDAVNSALSAEGQPLTLR
jgi:folate-binding protein YgfZ